MDVMIGNIIDEKAVQDQVGYEKYDIVTANILADVLIPLSAGDLPSDETRSSLYYFRYSGCKEDVVVKAVKDAGLEVLEVTSGRMGFCHCKKTGIVPEEDYVRFFADSSAIGEKEIIIRGSDLNHMKNVLRLSDWRTDLHP